MCDYPLLREQHIFFGFISFLESVEWGVNGTLVNYLLRSEFGSCGKGRSIIVLCFGIDGGGHYDGNDGGNESDG